jgi:cation diffusion facilitator family transporter
LLILGIKFYAAHLSNSSALYSDALEGTVNVLAAAFGLGSLLFAEKPADQDHPYGHGKIEYFAQAFEGGLIALAGFLILIDTGSRLLNPEPILELSTGLKLNALAGVMNGILGALLYTVGKRHQSEILKADGVHLLTDLLTTVVLLLGLGLMLLTGWNWLDLVLSAAVAGLLLFTGYHLVKQSANALLDGHDPSKLEQIVTAMNEVKSSGDFSQLITAHELKAQSFGREIHLDVHLVVPEFLTVLDAHHLSDRFSSALHDKLGKQSMVHTHLDPCERHYCEQCLISACPIRVSKFVKAENFTVASVTSIGKN